jgi:hypothetical protein
MLDSAQGWMDDTLNLRLTGRKPNQQPNQRHDSQINMTDYGLTPFHRGDLQPNTHPFWSFWFSAPPKHGLRLNGFAPP